MLAYAVAASLLTLAASGTMPAWHVARGASDLRLSLAGWWHVLVSLPLLLALLLGWMWRLYLWTRFLWLVARLDLQLVPAHPDRAAGRVLVFAGKPVDREALGAADFSATTDLYATVANVYGMRVVPLDLTSAVALVAVALLPFVPVVLLALPFDTILAFLAGLLH